MMRYSVGLLFSILVASVSCSRADLFAVTSEPMGGAGAPGDPTPVCPTPVLTPGDTHENLQVGSVTRSYVLHIPPTYDGSKPVPLIVDFHGMGESGMSELRSSPYPSVTDSEGVVMVFPDGLKGPLGSAWNFGPCCVADVDDLAFTRALVARVKQLACIDSGRIYAVGVLTGGGMVYELACKSADIFAAVAPAAFDLIEETVDDCVPQRPITEISFRGTADPRVPYAGGPSSLVPGMPITFLGAQATFEKWAAIHHCSDAAPVSDAQSCSTYSNCSGDAEVSLCTKPGGRDEPGDAELAWPVLKRHTL